MVPSKMTRPDIALPERDRMAMRRLSRLLTDGSATTSLPVIDASVQCLLRRFLERRNSMNAQALIKRLPPQPREPASVPNKDIFRRPRRVGPDRSNQLHETLTALRSAPLGEHSRSKSPAPLLADVSPLPAVWRSCRANWSRRSSSAHRRWPRVLAIAVALAGAFTGAPAKAGAGLDLDLSRYKLTFAAEFDDPKDLASKFIYHYRRWGNLRTLADNEERQLYVDDTFLSEIGASSLPSPFAVDKGLLTITARATPLRFLERLGLPYMSGMVTTEESFHQTYGYFEINCRMPFGKGLWPAFWLVGLTHDEPLEIDVVEVLEDAPATIYHSIHAPKRDVEWSITVDGPDTTSGFHSYGVDWRPDRIDFYIDRKKVGSAPVRLPGPMYMIANVAVGGEWPGNPDAMTVFPASMQIDHIRAYAPLAE